MHVTDTRPKPIVVAENAGVAEALRTILGSDVDVVDGGGRSCATSLGSSYAINGRRTVVVLEAHTAKPEIVAEQRATFRDVTIHGRSRCDLVLAVPTMDEADHDELRNVIDAHLGI